MSLAIPPITPAVAALAADLGVALQPGTIVTAEVLQVLDADLVRIAIANLTLDVTSAKPLQQGQTLQLAVAQSAEGLSLTPVTVNAATFARAAAVIVDDIPLAPAQAAPVAPALTALEARAVAQASQGAVTKQAGLSPLFANLSAAVASGNLPQPAMLAAAQVLGLRVPTGKPLTGADIEAAFESSGLMMEATLASPSSNALPDMKSALLVLRQALSSWTGQTGDATAAGKPGAGFLQASEGQTGDTPMAAGVAVAKEVAAAAVRSLLSKGGSAEASSVGKSLLTTQLLASALRGPANTSDQPPSTSNLPPPFRGATPTAQAVASPSLAPDAEPATIARQLLSDTEGALARQTLLQVASLPDRIDQQTLRSDSAQPRWNFEVPFITPQGTAMAQFEIARDGGHETETSSQRVWRARFSLDIEPAGPIHALIAFGGDTTSIKMWAERPATANQLRANVGQLGQSLNRAELKAGDIVVADGAPARTKPPAAGHFLNRAT